MTHRPSSDEQRYRIIAEHRRRGVQCRCAWPYPQRDGRREWHTGTCPVLAAGSNPR